MYNFDKAIDRSNTNSIKWDKDTIEYYSGNRDAIPYWVADMDLQTSDEIYKTITAAADFGIIGYPSQFEKVLPLFADFVRKRHNYEIEKELTTYVQGMLHGISLALSVFSNENDKVFVHTPYYHPFKNLVKNLKREFVPSPLDYKNGIFSFNKDKFLNDSKDARVILFCSPHNPSGLVFKKEDLEFVLKSAKERNQIVLSDEIHADLTHTGITHYPMGLVNKSINADTVTFFAPSKTFNVAGEHFAMAVFSNKTLFDTFKEKQEALFLDYPGHFALEIGIAAYQSYEYNNDMCKHLKENADLIKNYLKNNIPDLKLSNSEASFVSFIDCSSIYGKVLKLKEKYPDKFPSYMLLSYFFGHFAGICFNDGSTFGKEYNHFIRFNYGTSKEKVLYALENMKKTISELK